MPKLLLLLLAAFALGCSSQESAKDSVSQENLGPEIKDPEVGTAPGMIPAGCESLLNQSQAWGYIPGQKWKANSQEQIFEVARFFAEFRLVPASTSEALRGFENGGDPPPADVQYCDVFLAQTFLEAVVNHNRWSREEKREAGRQLHRFLLNQQSLSLPLVHRTLSAQIFVGAVKKGLVPGSRAKAQALGAWIEKAVAELPPEAPGEEVKSLRQQAQLSGKIRDRMGAMLPLP